jgi:hypothetical protein
VCSWARPPLCLWCRRALWRWPIRRWQLPQRGEAERPLASELCSSGRQTCIRSPSATSHLDGVRDRCKAMRQKLQMSGDTPCLCRCFCMRLDIWTLCLTAATLLSQVPSRQKCKPIGVHLRARARCPSHCTHMYRVHYSTKLRFFTAPLPNIPRRSGTCPQRPQPFIRNREEHCICRTTAADHRQGTRPLFPQARVHPAP